MGAESKTMGRQQLKLRKKTDYQGEKNQLGLSIEIPNDCFVKSFEQRN